MMTGDDYDHDREVCIPDPRDYGVAFACASRCERDGSVSMAEARQQIAHELVGIPSWYELTEAEREDAAAEARTWLRAARRAGIAPLPPRAPACSGVTQFCPVCV